MRPDFTRAREHGAQFLLWWGSELAALLPPRLRHRRDGRCDIIVERNRTLIERVLGSEGETFEDPVPLGALDDDSWQEIETIVRGLPTRVVLRPPYVHVVEVSLPRAVRQTRSALALALTRLSPVDVAGLTWSYRQAGRTAKGTRFQVAMAQTSRLADVTRLFARNGLPIPPICAAADGAPIRLLAGSRVRRTPRDRLRRHALLIALGLLATIPLTTLVAASWITASNERAAARIETAIAPQLEMERRATRVEQLRRTLAPLLARPSVSAMIEELSEILPDDASVTTIAAPAGAPTTITLDLPEGSTAVEALTRRPVFGNATIVDQVPEGERMLTTIELAP